jgi:hypothetical protein
MRLHRLDARHLAGARQRPIDHCDSHVLEVADDGHLFDT